MFKKTYFIILIADFQSCSAEVAAARFTIREVEKSVSAFVAASSDDI